MAKKKKKKKGRGTFKKLLRLKRQRKDRLQELARITYINVEQQQNSKQMLLFGYRLAHNKRNYEESKIDFMIKEGLKLNAIATIGERGLQPNILNTMREHYRFNYISKVNINPKLDINPLEVLKQFQLFMGGRILFWHPRFLIHYKGADFDADKRFIWEPYHAYLRENQPMEQFEPPELTDQEQYFTQHMIDQKSVFGYTKWQIAELIAKHRPQKVIIGPSKGIHRQILVHIFSQFRKNSLVAVKNGRKTQKKSHINQIVRILQATTGAINIWQRRGVLIFHRPVDFKLPQWYIDYIDSRPKPDYVNTDYLKPLLPRRYHPQLKIQMVSPKHSTPKIPQSEEEALLNLADVTPNENDLYQLVDNGSKEVMKDIFSIEDDNDDVESDGEDDDYEDNDEDEDDVDGNIMDSLDSGGWNGRQHQSSDVAGDIRSKPLGLEDLEDWEEEDDDVDDDSVDSENEFGLGPDFEEPHEVEDRRTDALQELKRRQQQMQNGQAQNGQEQNGHVLPEGTRRTDTDEIQNYENGYVESDDDEEDWEDDDDVDDDYLDNDSDDQDSEMEYNSYRVGRESQFDTGQSESMQGNGYSSYNSNNQEYQTEPSYYQQQTDSDRRGTSDIEKGKLQNTSFDDSYKQTQWYKSLQEFQKLFKDYNGVEKQTARPRLVDAFAQKEEVKQFPPQHEESNLSIFYREFRRQVKKHKNPFVRRMQPSARHCMVHCLLQVRAIRAGTRTAIQASLLTQKEISKEFAFEYLSKQIHLGPRFHIIRHVHPVYIRQVFDLNWDEIQSEQLQLYREKYQTYNEKQEAMLSVADRQIDDVRTGRLEILERQHKYRQLVEKEEEKKQSPDAQKMAERKQRRDEQAMNKSKAKQRRDTERMDQRQETGIQFIRRR